MIVGAATAWIAAFSTETGNGRRKSRKAVEPSDPNAESCTAAKLHDRWQSDGIMGYEGQKAMVLRRSQPSGSLLLAWLEGPCGIGNCGRLESYEAGATNDRDKSTDGQRGWH